MKLYKKSERIFKLHDVLKGASAIGYHTHRVGEYRRWKELPDGSRLSVKIDVFFIKNLADPTIKGYVLGDTFGRLAAPIVPNKEEVMQWLKDHEYKTDKQFYMEDCGMTLETWNQWNGIY